MFFCDFLVTTGTTFTTVTIVTTGTTVDYVARLLEQLKITKWELVGEGSVINRVTLSSLDKFKVFKKLSLYLTEPV